MGQYLIYHDGGIFKPIQAKCECGEIHTFRNTELDVDHNKVGGYRLKHPLKCNCGREYELITSSFKEVKEYPKTKIKKYSVPGTIIGILFLGLLAFGGYEFFHAMASYPDNSTPTNIKDMTRKQYNQFMKWENNKQQQQKSNQKLNGNN